MDNSAPQFAFNIGDRVSINANGIDGTVDALFVDCDTVQYRVTYADSNGAVFDRYFRAHEIAAA